MIGFGGAPTGAPPSATSPLLRPNDFVSTSAATQPARQDGSVTGPGSGTLLVTVVA